MTTPTEQLKSIVRQFSSSINTPGYSYSQLLEISAKVIAGSESWNHLAAKQLDTIDIDLSIPLLFERLDSGFTVSPSTAGHPGLWFIDAFERWLIGAELLSVFLGMDRVGVSALMECLKACRDLADLDLPLTILDGQPVSIIDSPDIPDYEVSRMIIGSWYYKNHLAPGANDSRDSWGKYSTAAEASGHSEAAVGLYRSACRESFNHSWSISSMVALGLLGTAAQTELLRKDSQILIDDIKQLWEYEEPEALGQ